jgi:MbtH protein
VDDASDVFDEYLTVISDEDQYSIWPAEMVVPPGWREAGCRGSKEDCLSYIGSVWTDMRPRSLKLAMQNAADNSQESHQGNPAL